jgi:hypothetical protein
MKAFFKVAGLLILLAVLGVGALVLYAVQRDSESAAERAAVIVTARYDSAACGTGVPLSITIENGARRTVKGVSIQLELYEEGQSDNLIDVANGQLESTSVIRSGATAKSCWRMPRLRRQPSRGVVLHAGGRPTFYEENEFIPPDPREAPPPADPDVTYDYLPNGVRVPSGSGLLEIVVQAGDRYQVDGADPAIAPDGGRVRESVPEGVHLVRVIGASRPERSQAVDVVAGHMARVIFNPPSGG